jgi:hypothetical protein
MTTTLALFLLAALRIVHFSGGTAFVTPQSDGTQRVVIKDAKGNVASDSYCDSQSGLYDQTVRFNERIISAARRRDHAALLTLVQFPLRVNASPSKHIVIKDPMDFQTHYARIFTASVLSALGQADPHAVFCRNGMSMIGSGVVWVTADKTGALKAAVINQ